MTWPRVATARRARTAGCRLPLAAVATSELPIPDHQAYTFPEVAKPACVQALPRERYGHLADEWVSQVDAAAQLRATALPAYRPGWLVIGEAMHLHSLDWNAATEQYEYQLTAENEADEELPSLNLVCTCPTDDYWGLQPPPGTLIIGRRQLNPLTRQSA